MLILCGLWGLRSNIWRRRGPQISTEATDEEISSQTVAADTNAAAPGSFSKLSGMGGGAAPAAAAALGFTLDRSAICIAADPAGLVRASSSQPLIRRPLAPADRGPRTMAFRER